MDLEEQKAEHLKDLDTKQKEVYRILLLEVAPDGRTNHKPCIKDDKIISGEIYIPNGSKSLSKLDPDMSDIAILFYETIYDSITILKKKRIELYDENVRKKTEIRHPLDLNFMGDTMITSFEEFKYHHCLANFWVLPFKIGRSLDHKYGRGVFIKLNDKMDLFLRDLNERKQEYSEDFEGYFEKFKIGEEFYTKHYLVDGFIKNDEIKPIETISDAEIAIDNRAYMISKNKGEELYDLFSELDMV